MDIKCPACGSDHTQKLSLFVRSNTFSSKGEALGVGGAAGHFGAGVAVTQGSTASNSAKEFAEPVATPVFGASIAIAVISAVIWAFSPLLAGILLIVGIAGVVGMVHKNMTEVPKVHAEWLRKFICLRCSTVYAPAP